MLGSAVNVGTEMVTSYPTPAASTMAWPGSLWMSLPLLYGD
jgi:hypothetical protein